MKNLRKFETETAFNTEKPNLEEPWVTLTSDDDVVHFSEQELLEVHAGDIVYKMGNGCFKAVAPSEWDASLGTPVGVCDSV